MRKKGILAVFILAALLTGINFYFYGVRGISGWGAFPLSVIRGFSISLSCFETERGLICPTLRLSSLFYSVILIIDFLFWFLLLILGWWGIKRLRIGGKKRT